MAAYDGGKDGQQIISQPILKSRTVSCEQVRNQESGTLTQVAVTSQFSKPRPSPRGFRMDKTVVVMESPSPMREKSKMQAFGFLFEKAAMDSGVALPSSSS
jgi:hypothetical protein